MNRSNLNWTDNRVLGASAPKPPQETPQMRPYTDVSPSTYPYVPDSGMPQASYPETATMPAQQSLPYTPTQGNDTQGSVTRNSAYAPTPIIDEPGPPSVMDPGYIPGYLRTQIGKRVRAEFVFTNQFLDKSGILKYVGYNYFVLEDLATRAMIMCDLYSARFITSA